MTGTLNALSHLWLALGGTRHWVEHLQEQGKGNLASAFPVSDLAAASIGAVGLALTEWCDVNGAPSGGVALDRRLASLWFSFSIRPDGWSLPPAWDAIAGDYRTADGWIRLHTNAPHHRTAALRVIETAAQREKVAAAVALWQADALETAIVSAGGCAAAMRSRSQWLAHPQGVAVAAEPLVHSEQEGDAGDMNRRFNAARPLKGIKVLDLTRILAGPTATRVLAGFGADVLRIDPPDWEEPSLAPDVTLGKRCARLNLKTEAGRAVLRTLVREADIFVSGYRADALEGMGFGAETRRALNPGLIDVSLDAYGWSGPWARRRGFDSLVQMSAGIAKAGMRASGGDRPAPLPVQAIDHATGYILAAAAIRGLVTRQHAGCGSRWRTSLARVAEFLSVLPASETSAQFPPLSDADFTPAIEKTAWGPAHRLRPPLTMTGRTITWDRPAGRLGADDARWW